MKAFKWNLFVGAFLLSLTACIGGVKRGAEMKGSRLTLQRNYLALNWSESSPLSTLITSSSRWIVIAKYSDINGNERSERITTPQSPLHGSLRFALPRTLSSTPAGPACFAIINSRSGRPLPVREAGHVYGSSGFKMTRWVEAAAARTSEIENDPQKLEQRLSELNSMLLQPNRSEEQYGVTSSAQCDTLEAPRVEIREIDAESASDAAAQACLARVFQITGRKKAVFNDFHLLMRKYASALKANRERLTQAELRRYSGVTGFLRAYGRYSATVTSPGYESVLANQSILGWDLRKKLDPADFATAFYGCEREAAKQIEYKLRSQRKMLRQGPVLEAEHTEFIRAACRADMARSLEQKAKIRQEIAGIEQRLEAAKLDSSKTKSNSPRSEEARDIALQACLL